MKKRELQLVEFDKIIVLAQKEAYCEGARTLLKSSPMCESSAAMRRILQKTDALLTMCLSQSAPSLFFVGEDFRNIVKRAELGGVLSMPELLCVASSMRNGARLTDFRNSVKNFSSILDEDFFYVYENRKFTTLITDAIISETEMSDKASITLLRIRREILNTEGSIKEKLLRTIKSGEVSKLLQDNVIAVRNGRFVVPVKAEHKGDFAGVIHDVSASGSTIFIEPAAVVMANAKILQLKNEEQIEIRRILQDFSTGVAAIASQLYDGYTAMISLDCMLARAKLAKKQNGVLPTVDDGTHFSLVGARHPLIPKEKVVAIDISIDKAFDTLIITGPNTGGKTVTLKTVGLLLCMAMHGFLLPVNERSIVCRFNNIFVDIGDEQSIEQNLSTFSGHIKNIKDILSEADNNSLVLLDELGAGTDPAEGAALAVSIIEQLVELGAKTIATTHYAELKMFALQTENIQNASCEFDIATLRPTYKIILGVPGRSNAFLISEKLGLHPDIIKRATKHLSSENKRFEEVLQELDNIKAELVIRQEETKHLANEAQSRLEAAKEQGAAILKDADNILISARQKAEKTLNDVERSAYSLIDEVKRLQKEERLTATEKSTLAREILRKSEHLSDIQKIPQYENFEQIENCEIGDEVYIIDLSLCGRVFSVNKSKKCAVVVVGNIKSSINFSNLAKAPQNTIQKPLRRVRQSNIISNAQRSATSELMLLGKNVDEAIMLTDSFIDNAIICGLPTVYLVHGKGTGALRRGLHSHLGNHKNVRRFRTGIYGEGEDGVTIVEIK